MIYFLASILALAIYLYYQGSRYEEVGNIRTTWTWHGDPRHEQYSYEEMYSPSLSNYFGLRWPRDKHFKKRDWVPGEISGNTYVNEKGEIFTDD
jgi:hypothetical protein